MCINKHLRLSNTKIINNNQYKTSITKEFNEFISFVILMVLCAYIFLPAMVLAASLEGQLDRIGGDHLAAKSRLLVYQERLSYHLFGR